MVEIPLWYFRHFTTLDILFRATYIHVKINEKELPPERENDHQWPIQCVTKNT